MIKIGFIATFRFLFENIEKPVLVLVSFYIFFIASTDIVFWFKKSKNRLVGAKNTTLLGQYSKTNRKL